MKTEKETAVQKWKARKDFTSMLAVVDHDQEPDVSQDTLKTKDDDLTDEVFEAIQKVDKI